MTSAGESLVLQTADALRDQLSSTVSSIVRTVANVAKVLGVVNVILTLADAYDRCIGA